MRTVTGISTQKRIHLHTHTSTHSGRGTGTLMVLLWNIRMVYSLEQDPPFVRTSLQPDSG